MTPFNQHSQKTNSFSRYYDEILCQDLLLKNNYKNISELPKFQHIVINTTSSMYALDRKNLLPGALALELITGQKVQSTSAKKSLAPFKIREKQILGCKVTLRGKNLYNFLTIFSSIVLPKFRDFSGISKKSFDSNGNFSLGFTQLLLFPQLENHFELFHTFRGVNMNFCTNQSRNKGNHLLLSAYQFPERK